MTTMTAQEHQMRFAQGLVAEAPTAWTGVRAAVTAVAGVGGGRAWAEVDGSEQRILLGDALDEAMALQDVMYQPGTGTWFSFTCTIETDGAYHFTFNYDDHAPFPDGREPLRDSWIKELRRHPRPWHLIPEWHPVKHDYTEQQWADDIAAYEASDDYCAPTGRR